MHQEHNIPWNKLASNLTFIRNNPNVTPHSTGLFLKAKSPAQSKELNHFVRVVEKTIRTFSDTERTKFPSTFPTATSGKLFSDELREKYPEFLNEQNQLIENWITSTSNITSDQGSLADVVKILLNEGELDTLLMLAQHPSIPVINLNHLSWGHHFWFSRVAESALQMYIFFNVVAAAGILQTGQYTEITAYDTGFMITNLTRPFDYPAQQLPHRSFFDTEKLGYGKDRRNDVHRDLPRLRDYLKELFRLLYRYDLFVRECGGNTDWNNEIVSAMRDVVGGTKLKYMQVDGQWIHIFI